MSEENKINFGITSETKTSNNVPLPVATKVEKDAQFPNGWKFPIARLVNIVANTEFEKKDGSIVAIIDFIFKDSEGRQFIHREWELETSDSNFNVKLEGMQVRIAHIWSQTLGKVPQEGIGANASSFADFFTKVQQAFDSKIVEIEDKKYKAYSTVNLYVKLTYYKKNFGFPLSPNFLEKAEKGKPCRVLNIDTRYDNLEPATSNAGIPGLGSMGNSGAIPGGDDIPDFDAGFN